MVNDSVQFEPNGMWYARLGRQFVLRQRPVSREAYFDAEGVEEEAVGLTVVLVEYAKSITPSVE